MHNSTSGGEVTIGSWKFSLVHFAGVVENDILSVDGVVVVMDTTPTEGFVPSLKKTVRVNPR